MMTCEEAARLISESLDQPLPLRKRMGLKLHLLMCKLCPQFLRHLLFLSEAAKRETGEEEGEPSLSPGAREKIKRSFTDLNQGVTPRNKEK